MSKIINLTPHKVLLLDEATAIFDPKSRSYKVSGDPVIIASFDPEGIVPRCTQRETSIGTINGINILQMEYGKVENLPEPEVDTYYIVSALVAQAAKRDDLLVPARQVRNEDGQIIGCLAFSRP